MGIGEEHVSQGNENVLRKQARAACKTSSARLWGEGAGPYPMTWKEPSKICHQGRKEDAGR